MILKPEMHSFANSSIRNIFLVSDRDSWYNCEIIADLNLDLVFCLDFGLKKQLEREGFNVFFFDHLVDRNILQEQNFNMHRFLDTWYQDTSGKDLFEYKGVTIGNSVLLNIIADVTSYCHFFFNAVALKDFNYQSLITALDDDLICKVLDDLKINYTKANQLSKVSQNPKYLFPIALWVESQLNKESLKKNVSNLLKGFLDIFLNFVDFFSARKKNIYIQEYYPTEEIVAALSRSKIFKIRTSDYSTKRNIFSQRRLPRSFFKGDLKNSIPILNRFNSESKNTWEFAGYVLSDFLYQIISKDLSTLIARACEVAERLNKHFLRDEYSLVIPVTNYWMENRIVMNLAKKNGIPIFMIANGLLNMRFETDGRDSDFINCYSESVKEDYFFGASNAVCLGDPRMDKYSLIKKKNINRKCPKIVIGAAGFNNIDLNSYLAYEFDFLHDVLSVLHNITQSGLEARIVLKVRSNGYSEQYSHFVKEYFPSMDIEIVQNIQFAALIQEADLYISIYSQTLFEASVLGIPVIYYKKDTQFIDRPFDEFSEVVMAKSPKELHNSISAFYEADTVFSEFLKKEVLEKYIGFLDGRNTQRNIEFISSLVTNKNSK